MWNDWPVHHLQPSAPFFVASSIANITTTSCHSSKSSACAYSLKSPQRRYPRCAQISFNGSKIMSGKCHCLCNASAIDCHLSYRFYYQYNPERLPMCPLTIHALLHIADSIEMAGPVWAYWAFPMERYCGFLGQCIKNRRFPFANLDAYCVAMAQLDQIKCRYDLHEVLALKAPRSTNVCVDGGALNVNCKLCFGLNFSLS